MFKIFALLGSLNAALAVVLGAFGAHALRGSLNADLLAVWRTGNEYHFYHALGLILIGLFARVTSGGVLLGWAAGLMLAGILLFSGSLYVLSGGGIRVLGVLTPLGGAAFIAAWLLLAVAVWRG